MPSARKYPGGDDTNDRDRPFVHRQFRRAEAVKDGAAAWRPNHRQAVGGCRRLDAGKRAQRGDGAAIERDALLGGYRAPGQPDLHRQHVVPVDAVVGVRATPSPCCTRSPAPHSRITVMATWHTTSALPEARRLRHARPAGAQRADQATGARRASPARGRRSRRSAIDRPSAYNSTRRSTCSSGARRRSAGANAIRASSVQRGEEHAEHAAGDRQQQALDQQLPDDRESAGAERRTEGRSRGGATTPAPAAGSRR